VSFATRWDDVPRDLSQFDLTNADTNPEVAAIFYHADGNKLRFRDLDKLQSTDQEVVETATQSIAQEIQQERLSPEEAHDRMEAFNESMGRRSMNDQNGTPPSQSDAPIYSCACCGKRDMNRGKVIYREVPIENLQILKVDNDMREQYTKLKSNPIKLPRDEQGTMTDFYLHRALNVYESSNANELYALHEEFVFRGNDEREFAMLCGSCFESIDEGYVPENAVKKKNFGNLDRIGLMTLTQLERSLLALVRHLYKIVKIQNNCRGRSDLSQWTIRSHHILFLHDAPYVTAQAFLSLDSWRDMMKLHFIGTADEIDVIMNRTRGSSIVYGRAFVLYQHAMVLKILNPHYAAVKIPQLSELRESLQSFEEHLMKTAMIDDGSQVMARETVLGDDIANVSTSLMSPSTSTIRAVNSEDSRNGFPDSTTSGTANSSFDQPK
jgi:hypothetical protein